MSATPPAPPTNMNSLGISLANLLQLVGMLAAGLLAYSGLDKQVELTNQRVDVLQSQISTYQFERKEDTKRVEDKLDKISARIDALLVKGASK
ncbi:hypothetical protein [Pseudomonas fluorescens]|uniref:Uncharacterized protein n=1 Tax=Pseudomonas fluorescens TaxID=294 RepID=A0A0F4VEK9_PSEFL|nr:hypothetical protein [Pseudomonas fluorescens]KJZ67253.1 hypothetical protein VD17_03050 [Pseudomonas fluorescens]